MMDRLRKSIEERANVWEQAKAFLDGTEPADFTGEQEETYQRYTERLDSLDAEIRDLNELIERDKRADEVRAKWAAYTPAAPAGEKKETDADVIRKLAKGELRSFDFKRETRDVLQSGSGANLIPTGFLNQLYVHMVDEAHIRQTNVRVIQTDSGNDLAVPKTTAHSAAAIIGEGSPITESDPTFAQVVLQSYKYAFLTQVSREMLEDSGVDLVGYLAAEGGKALGRASGAHFLTGTGTGQPNGLVTASTLGKTGGTGVSGAFTADDLVDLFYSVIASYRGRGTWGFSDAGIAALRKLKGSDNNYLWQPGLAIAEESTLMGRPIMVDNAIADPALSARSVVFGDFSAYFIRDVNGVRVERSDDFAFNADLSTWRFIFRTDGDLIDTTGAVKHFVGAGT